MTMMLASGTSTPTSTTVVATRSGVRAAGEGRDRRFLVAAGEAAVRQPDQAAEPFGEQPMPLHRRHRRVGLAALDHRADPVDPLAAGQRPVDGVHHLVDPLDGHGPGDGGGAARRLLDQVGGGDVAIGSEHQAARDRRRGHQQHVDGPALVHEVQALADAEPVLLVDHRQAQIAERHPVLEQSVRAHRERASTGGQPLQCRPALRRRGPCRSAAPRRMPSGAKRRRKRRRVLPCQHLGRHHQCRLGAGLGRLQHGCQRHQRLAAADIALQQPQHRRRCGQLAVDLGDGPALAVGEREGQGRQQPVTQAAVAPAARGRPAGPACCASASAPAGWPAARRRPGAGGPAPWARAPLA